MRGYVLAMVVLLLAAAVVPVLGEFVYVKEWEPKLASYKIEEMVMTEDGRWLLVAMENPSDKETCWLSILNTTTLEEIQRFEFDGYCDYPTFVDYHEDLNVVVMVAQYDPYSTVFLINLSDMSIDRIDLYSAGGPTEYLFAYWGAWSGNYLYVAVYDQYDAEYKIYMVDPINRTTMLMTFPNNGLAINKIVNHDTYVLLWDGEFIGIYDGSTGSLVATYMFKVGDVNEMIGYYDPSFHEIYIAFGNDTGVYFARYTIGEGLRYIVELEDRGYTPFFVAQVGLDDYYIVCTEGMGYRVYDVLSDPTVTKEGLPFWSLAYRAVDGYEYVYTHQLVDVEMYQLVVPYTTVTTTVTQALPMYETETVVRTETVQGPYSATDLAIAVIISAVLGAAVAYIILRGRSF